jgi:uncharacterized protein YbcI
VADDPRVFGHVGFFFSGGSGWPQPPGANPMNQVNRSDPAVRPENAPTMAQQIAMAVSAFEQRLTGRAPKSVAVVLCGETLVVTLHGALSPAEQALANSPAGAAEVQEYHRQLFATSFDELRREIKRITGVEVREAAAEVEPATGTVVKAFTSGAVVQVYLLAATVPTEAWSGNRPGGNSRLSGGAAVPSGRDGQPESGLLLVDSPPSCTPPPLPGVARAAGRAPSFGHAVTEQRPGRVGKKPGGGGAKGKKRTGG